MDKKNIRILVVDDEETLCEGLRTYLELEGYTVDTSLSAEEALKLDLSAYDLLLLDIMMDGVSGTEMATIVRNRESTFDMPIIFLTAKDSLDDMVSGLKLADDYISKPYEIKNLLARIEAVLRRSSRHRLMVKGVSCDRASMACYVDGHHVKMPRKEFEILALLLENPGRVFTREELISRIWPDNVIVVDRAVDVHVARIRGKIAPYSRHIVARTGYGYGWED
ncbi:MAG: response regulator transcription factor [Muribaculaceae bacterium]